jgi:hypothetical protein
MVRGNIVRAGEPCETNHRNGIVLPVREMDKPRTVSEHRRPGVIIKEAKIGARRHDGVLDTSELDGKLRMVIQVYGISGMYNSRASDG